MLRVEKLSEVGLLLTDTIRGTVGPGVDVRLASPVEDPDSGDPSVRVSFLWITPSSASRNEKMENLPDGRNSPVSSTLHVFYMISACGTSVAGNCIAGHDLLGQMIAQFNNAPTINSPDVGESGDGLNVMLAPADAELLGRIYRNMQVRPRPWMVVDVGPIQLGGGTEES